jgi:hypothetical protein
MQPSWLHCRNIKVKQNLPYFQKQIPIIKIPAFVCGKTGITNFFTATELCASITGCCGSTIIDVMMISRRIYDAG